VVLIPTNSGFQTSAAGPSYGEYGLVELQFRDGTGRFTTWPVNVEVFGQVWQGTGNLGKIGPLHESEDGAEEKLTLSLSPVDLGTRAIALGDPSSYQDRPVRVWVGMINAETYQPNGVPVLRFVGVMDQLKIERDDDKGTISLDCRTASYDVRSNPASLRMNNAQHQARRPGERGFEYLTSLIGNPAVWVSKSLQGRLNEIARKKG
jgi:hypothetical protein